MKTNSPIEPFPDDLSYVLAEMDWIHRSSRARTAESDLLLEQGRGSQAETDRKLAQVLRHEEKKTRCEIDSRLGINRTSGPELGLDRICGEHRLNEFERTLILVAVLPVLGTEQAVERLEHISPRWSPETACPEAVWELLRMDHRARLLSLSCLLPGSLLVSNGIVHLSHQMKRPADVPGVGVEVSWSTLAVVTGLPDLFEAVVLTNNKEQE